MPEANELHTTHQVAPTTMEALHDRSQWQGPTEQLLSLVAIDRKEESVYNGYDLGIPCGFYNY